MNTVVLQSPTLKLTEFMDQYVDLKGTLASPPDAPASATERLSQFQVSEVVPKKTPCPDDLSIKR